MIIPPVYQGQGYAFYFPISKICSGVSVLFMVAITIASREFESNSFQSLYALFIALFG